MSKTSEREAIIGRLVDALKQQRLARGLSLNQVATLSGLSHTMVMRVEKRERLPTIDTLLRISEAVEADLSLLLARAMRR